MEDFKEHILVSIIIPVYNAENYLHECIKSLINQTLNECEFIFVNDGSKDNSKNIIKNYQLNDKRIKLINQENQGVSVARNKGLSIAKGEYIGFVDADDSINLNMIEVLYNEISRYNLDLIMCNFESSLDGNKTISSPTLPTNRILNRRYIEENLLIKFIDSDELNTVCTKLYRSSLIKSNNIQFPEKIELGEDGIFNLRYMIKAKNLKYVSYTGYYYREVNGSATRDMSNKDYFQEALHVYLTDLPEFNNININKEVLKKSKITKFIDKVISNIYIYLVPNNGIKLSNKLRYVHNMIKNNYVKEAIIYYRNEYYNEKNRYDKFIIKMIHRRSTIGLYLLTLYSWSRNRC